MRSALNYTVAMERQTHNYQAAAKLYYDLAEQALRDERHSPIQRAFHWASALSNLGHVLLAAGFPSQAIDTLTTVIEQQPYFYAARYTRGMAWKALGNCRNALIDFSVASLGDPVFPMQPCSL